MINNNEIHPTKISMEQWGRKVSLEIPNSDTDIHDLLQLLKGVVIGLGYAESVWNIGITDMGEDIYSVENENLKTKMNEWKD